MLQQIPTLYTDLVIPNGGTTSNAVKMTDGGGQFAGLVWDTAMTGTTVTVQMSWDNGTTWHKVEDLTPTFVSGVGDFKDLDSNKYRAVSQIRLVSDMSEAAERTIKLIGSII